MRKILTIVLGLLAITSCTSCAKQEFKELKHLKPIVLIIGDSISIGYTPFLKNELKDYNVIRVNENCRNSFYNKKNVEKWLKSQKNTDIVIWNAGIWNTIINFPEEPQENLTTTIQQYSQDIEYVAEYLKNNSKKVLFLTTTHITPNTVFFEAGKEELLNDAAKLIMSKKEIKIIDLGQFSKSLEYLKFDSVHYEPDAYKKMATFIVSNL